MTNAVLRISSSSHALFLSIFPETEDVDEQEQWIPLHHPQMHCLIVLFHREMLPFWRQSTFQSKKDHIITALILFSTETAQFSYYHITIYEYWQAGTLSISWDLGQWFLFVKTHCSCQKQKSPKIFWDFTVKWVKVISSDVTFINAGRGQPQVWKMKTPECTFYYLPWKFPQKTY